MFSHCDAVRQGDALDPSVGSMKELVDRTKRHGFGVDDFEDLLADTDGVSVHDVDGLV